MIWKNIKDFFNSFNRNTIVTRKQYLLAINQSGRVGYTTPDVIRRYLTLGGYLRVMGRGRFGIVREIPSGLTLNQLRRDAYGRKSKKELEKEFASRPYDEDFER